MSTRPAHPEQIAVQRNAAGHRQLKAAPRADLSSPLFQPGLARCVISSYAILWVGTVLFALLTIPFAGPLRHLFPFTGDLATPGSAGWVAFILANNAREAVIPFLFAVLRVGTHRWPILFGDVVITACLSANVALSGFALGTYGMRALPFLPQWPLEWGAFALALAAWRRARVGRRDPLELTLLAIATATMLCGAALLETYAVPQS
jgi:hypothetical protein